MAKNNVLLDKLKKAEKERQEKYRNKWVDGKECVKFDDFRSDMAEGRVEMSCVTKMKQHVKDERGNYETDENGDYLWEDIYAFCDARFPDSWSFGGSALRTIYNSLVDEETTEDDVNEILKDNPITFYLDEVRLTNGRNKGQKFIAWLTEKPEKTDKKSKK